MIKLFTVILNEHIRSQRILVELAIVGFTAFFVLRGLHDSHATQATLVLYSFLATLYTTSVLADSNEQPLAIQRVLAMPDRYALLVAIALSAVSIAVASYALLIIIGTMLNPLAMPSVATLLLSLPSVILVMITAVVFMLLMTPLVATTTQRLVVLAIITIPVAWNIAVSTINLSMPHIDGAWVAALTTLWGFILWPGFAVYNHAITPDYSATNLLFHGIHTCIIAGLALIGRHWFDRKSLAVA